MPLTSFHDWIRKIYATRDDELDCEQVFELLPKYVDMVTSGQAFPPGLARVEHHLKQCPYCHDLYLGLRDAVKLENQRTASEMVILERTRFATVCSKAQETTT
jgi:predicted anti-sigma-YlaC factor YlaD